ncbi:hypothetical protein [Aphanothece sacrum]|uniref:Uncharacterized protein n=1 Tax=Aphanothece sacrum FPU1 TaxID=1920663 RepID=A0A401ILL6_APHSA|nr:hypothetical protein [Aphanothece sacrum]GBF82135.1 hypothetical protein AsFPU1_3562 [Aphanothece sacrum FPU1]
MLNAKSTLLAGLAITLSWSAIAVTPAQAEPAQNEVLISQLRGHKLEDPIEVYRDEWLKFKFEDFAIGRIRGVTGDVAQIQIISPSSVRVGDRDVTVVSTSMPTFWPNLKPGDDAIMRVVDGKWVIVSDKRADLKAYQAFAMPVWVSRLDLKEVALIERTAINWSRPDVTIPPLPPNTAVLEPAPAPEPVPGLW